MTAFVTVSVQSTGVAVTSFVSVTMPPASSCACSRSHGVVRFIKRSSPFTASTAKAGLSLVKCDASAADAPVANVMGSDAVGSVSVVTPMDASAVRLLTVIVAQ